MPLPSGFSTLRDLACFALGGVILVHAVVLRDPPADLAAVALGSGLLGLPAVALTRRANDAASKRD